MSGLLRPCLPLGRGETPTSYVSRLAPLHRVPSGRQLCVELGIPYRALVEGEEHALERLAHITGAPLADISAGAFRRVAGGYQLRGQRLASASLSLASIRACPECLLADLAEGRPERDLAAYGRATWRIGSVRACPIHRAPIVEVVRESMPSRMYEFATIIGPALGSLRTCLADLPRREPSALETYLLRRLEGVTGDAPWLDGLPFYVAARTCEVVGSAAAFGIERGSAVVDDEDLHRAGGAGFDILSGGEEAFAGFLSMTREESYATGRRAPRVPNFGKIGAWLSAVRKNEDFRQVTDFVRAYVIRTCPVGPGDEVLSVPVERRRLHSIHTAAKETGAHPKRLRKLLDRAGLLQPAHAGLSDNHVLFDAEAAREVMETAANHLSLPGLAARLGLSVIQARSLVSAGVIVPFTPSGDGIGTPAFSMAAVDGLMARLFGGAVPLDEATKAGRVIEPVMRAFKRAQCSLAEVVALVLERKLGWVGTRAGGTDLSALFVDVTEVRKHVRGRELTGLTFLDAQFVLRRTYPVVKALVERGLLRTHMSVHPETRAPIRVIDRGDVETFKAVYATLFDLARERGDHHLKIKAELEEAGIRPTLRREDFGAAFYRKSDLPQ